MLKVLKRCRKLLLCFAFMFALCFVAVGSSPMVAYALEDNVGGRGGSSNDFNMQDLDSRDQDIIDAFNNWNGGMSAQDFSKASNTLAPLTNILGVIVGIILSLVFAGVFVITALDILYITIPPFRNILYKGSSSGGASMGGGYGGYGGGSMNQGMANEAKPTQWISDEAVQCAAMLSQGGAQSQQMGGGYGMGGMGGMQQGGANSNQNVSMKSVISMYFKKRMFFMVFLAVAALVLTSSILMKTGFNLGAWVLKIFNTINGNIPK